MITGLVAVRVRYTGNYSGTFAEGLKELARSYVIIDIVCINADHSYGSATKAIFVKVGSKY